MINQFKAVRGGMWALRWWFGRVAVKDRFIVDDGQVSSGVRVVRVKR